VRTTRFALRGGFVEGVSGKISTLDF